MKLVLTAIAFLAIAAADLTLLETKADFRGLKILMILIGVISSCAPFFPVLILLGRFQDYVMKKWGQSSMPMLFEAPVLILCLTVFFSLAPYGIPALLSRDADAIDKQPILLMTAIITLITGLMSGAFLLINYMDWRDLIKKTHRVKANDQSLSDVDGRDKDAVLAFARELGIRVLEEVEIPEKLWGEFSPTVLGRFIGSVMRLSNCGVKAYETLYEQATRVKYSYPVYSDQERIRFYNGLLSRHETIRPILDQACENVKRAQAKQKEQQIKEEALRQIEERQKQTLDRLGLVPKQKKAKS